MKFNKEKCKFLYLDIGITPGTSTSGDNHQESSSVKKGLGILGQQTEYESPVKQKKANTILGYIRKNVGSRLRNLIFLLH